jgi:hypothetical protein
VNSAAPLPDSERADMLRALQIVDLINAGAVTPANAKLYLIELAGIQARALLRWVAEESL